MLVKGKNKEEQWLNFAQHETRSFGCIRHNVRWTLFFMYSMETNSLVCSSFLAIFHYVPTQWNVNLFYSHNFVRGQDDCVECHHRELKPPHLSPCNLFAMPVVHSCQVHLWHRHSVRKINRLWFVCVVECKNINELKRKFIFFFLFYKIVDAKLVFDINFSYFYSLDFCYYSFSTRFLLLHSMSSRFWHIFCNLFFFSLIFFQFA